MEVVVVRVLTSVVNVIIAFAIRMMVMVIMVVVIVTVAVIGSMSVGTGLMTRMVLIKLRVGPFWQ